MKLLRLKPGAFAPDQEQLGLFKNRDVGLSILLFADIKTIHAIVF